MKTIAKVQSANGQRINYNKSGSATATGGMDRFKSLHNSGRFINNNSSSNQ